MSASALRRSCVSVVALIFYFFFIINFKTSAAMPVFSVLNPVALYPLFEFLFHQCHGASSQGLVAAYKFRFIFKFCDFVQRPNEVQT